MKKINAANKPPFLHLQLAAAMVRSTTCAHQHRPRRGGAEFQRHQNGKLLDGRRRRRLRLRHGGILDGNKQKGLGRHN